VVAPAVSNWFFVPELAGAIALRRHFRAEAGAEVPDLVRPPLELEIMGHPALERDGLVLGAPG
jgi:hypothetical protein